MFKINLTKIIILITIFILPVYGETNDKFLGIKNNKVYSRAGPGKEYPILNIYNKKGEPVKILYQSTDWYKIEDFNGEIGWIYKNLLSSKHFVIVDSKEKIGIFFKKGVNSKLQFFIEPKSRCKLLKCSGEFCKIEFRSNRGWTLKKHLWGV